MTGQTEESVAIGAGSYTKSEWNKFLDDFDDTQDTIREQMRDEIQKRVEKQCFLDMIQQRK